MSDNSRSIGALIDRHGSGFQVEGIPCQPAQLRRAQPGKEGERYPEEAFEAVDAKVGGLPDQVKEALARLDELEQKTARRGGGDERPESLGAQFIRAKADDLARVASDRGKTSMEVKATLTSATTDAAGSVGGLIVPQRDQIVGMPRRRLTIRNLLDVRNATSGSVEYPRQVGRPDGADMVAEGAAKPESDMQFELATVPMRVIAHWTKASRQVGVTTDTLQEFRYVATQAGIEQSDMDASLAKLTRTIGDADMGAKSQAEAFRVLGIATRDANGNLKTTDQILPELVKAFSEIKDPATRAALQVDIFGKSGQKLDTLLSGGVDQLNNLRNAAHKLGVVLSPELIARADDAADKLASLQMVMKTQIAGVVAENANAILGMADAIATATVAVGKFFTTMKGVERIQKYEGWSKGFFASWSEQDMASTDKGYAQRLLQQQLTAQDNLIKARNSYRAQPSEVRKRYVLRLVKELQETTERLNKFTGDLETAKAGANESLSTTATRVVSPRPKADGGGRSRGRAGSGAEKRDEFGEDLSALLERIKPEDLKAVEQYTAEQLMLAKALDIGKLSALEYDKALEQLSKRFIEGQFGERGSPLPEISAEEALGDYIKPADFDELTKAVDKQYDKMRLKNDMLAESFMVMAQRINSDLRSLVDGIKGGDFFDIMDGVLGLFSSLSQTGALGAGLQKTFSNAPAWSFGGFRADGGPVSSGKAYVVGERGPELFMPNSRGAIVPNLALGGVAPVRVGGEGRGRGRDKLEPIPIDINVTEAPGFASKVNVTAHGAAVRVNRGTMEHAARRGRQRLAQ